MSSIKQTVIVLVCLIALILGLVVARVLREPPMDAQQLAKMGAIVKQHSQVLNTFSLIDHQNQAFDNGRLLGKWSLIFFGYTYCPDVCPTTLALLAQMEKELINTPLSSEVQYLLASVDPERDSPEQLAQYLGHFGQGFAGVTGTTEQMFEFARDLNSMFAKVPTDEAGSYLVDHSMNIILINPAGEYHGFLRAPHQVAQMKAALLAIVNNY